MRNLWKIIPKKIRSFLRYGDRGKNPRQLPSQRNNKSYTGFVSLKLCAVAQLCAVQIAKCAGMNFESFTVLFHKYSRVLCKG